MKRSVFVMICLCLLFSCGNENETNNPEIIKVSKLIISEDSISLEIGDSKTLMCNTFPDNATEEIVCSWSSDNESIAVVGNGRYEGIVRAVSIGKTMIKVSDRNNDKLFASCILNVLPIGISSIKLDRSSMEMFIGDDSTLYATIYPFNATYKDVIWESSDETIATVKDGKICALSEGNVTIYAKSPDNTISGKCEVTIKSIKVSSIECYELKQLSEIVDGYDFHFACKFMIGSELALTFSVLPENAHNKEVEVSSSDENVVSVDDNFKLHANKAGIAVITISSKDGSATRAYNIIVGDITIFTVVSIKGSSISINGITRGELYSSLRNTSNYTITLTSFKFMDAGTNQPLLSVGSDVLGELAPHSFSDEFGGKFDNVYKPTFIWTYIYDGKTYQVAKGR